MNLKKFKFQNPENQILESYFKMKPIQIAKDGLCTCTCATKCPLGRTGSAMRCTSLELINAGFQVEDQVEEKKLGKKEKKLNKLLKLFREYTENQSVENSLPVVTQAGLDLLNNVAFLTGYNQQRFTTDDICHIEDEKSWLAGFEYGKFVTRLETECDEYFPRSVD